MVGRRWACRRGLAHKQGDCVETLDTFPYEQLLDNGLVDRVDRNRAVLPRVTANLLERGRNGELDVPVVACQYPINAQGTDRVLASYNRYVKLSVPATFEEIGGDPRKNRSITINPIDQSIVQKLLVREGVESFDTVPLFVSEPAPASPPPSDHELRELLHQAVVKDLLGPASAPDEEILG